jgi:hypothetical protein
LAENRAYQRLKKLFPKAHWQRLESWTGTGISDVNVCHQGVEVWIECKDGTLRKRDNCVVAKVRPSQIAWEQLRRDAGGRTFVAVMVWTDMYVIPGFMLRYLTKGIDLQTVIGRSIDPLDLFK